MQEQRSIDTYTHTHAEKEELDYIAERLEQTNKRAKRGKKRIVGRYIVVSVILVWHMCLLVTHSIAAINVIIRNSRRRQRTQKKTFERFLLMLGHRSQLIRRGKSIILQHFLFCFHRIDLHFYFVSVRISRSTMPTSIKSAKF